MHLAATKMLEKMPEVFCEELQRIVFEHRPASNQKRTLKDSRHFSYLMIPAGFKGKGMLLIVALLLVIMAAPSSANSSNQANDFIFITNDTFLDDEDTLSDQPLDDQGSADEGSGTPDTTPAFVIETSQPVFPTTQKKDDLTDRYKMTINFTSLRYSPALRDNSSSEYVDLAKSIERSLDSIYDSIPGNQTSRIIQFRPGSMDASSVLTYIYLTTYGLYNNQRIFTVLNGAIQKGYIGDYPVSSQGFTINADLDRIPAPKPTCSPNEFQCHDGACIDRQRMCDERVDCADRSDEFHCPSAGPTTCSPIEFRCADGNQCIDQSLLCDQNPDCSDGSDEENCPTEEEVSTCASNEFSCHNGNCIDRQDVCDGRNNCGDSSDEQNCPSPPVCDASEFQCDDGECIPGELRCDNNYDCADETDELECGGCLTTEFQCNDGSCILASQKCDGQQHCNDGKDEAEDNCRQDNPVDPTIPTCRRNEFQCVDGTCIRQEYQCNQREDCPDGTDEVNCEPPTRSPSPQHCTSSEFQCDDGTCIAQNMKCDYKYDCPDGTDEYLCPPPTRPPINVCGSDEFTCSDGDCIHERYRCDDEIDCSDGSDESDCATEPSPVACQYYEFQCNDGSCIDDRLKCDTYFDCPDRSDEYNCERPRVSCQYYEFQCNDGSCIDDRFKCDRQYDCPDGSDEDGCATEPSPVACQYYEFQCNDGSCIDDRLKCNTHFDCPDRSDEYNCATEPSPVACQYYEFQCNDGSCIDDRLKCNTHFDCPDRSDEYNCAPVTNPPRPTCQYYEFQCDDGTCIDDRLKCDQQYDCPDRTDEYNCEYPTEPPRVSCQHYEFQCSDGSCIDDRLKCDRQYDCPDGSDEDGCAPVTEPAPAACQYYEFQCDDGTCIDERLKCDRNYDCYDQSDEHNCAPPTTAAAPVCTSSEFRCSSGACIDPELRCNQQSDCFDGSDEFQCDVSASPSELRIRTGAVASFVCRSKSPQPQRLVWSRNSRSGELPRGAVDDNSGRLTISDAQVEDSGDYICTSIDTPGKYQAAVTLNVELVVGPTMGTPRPGRCQSGESMCTNGACIPVDYVCDGDYDCTDRSDELSCVTTLPCEPNEFKCDSGKCILKIWMCDGDDDCGGDKSDEKNCQKLVLETGCRSDEFQCFAGNQCIPSGYHCDGERDCQDGSDELGCTKPTAVKFPPSELMVEQGQTAVIECEALGIPAPLIVWRLNWGHTGASPRVTATVDKIPGRPGQPITSKGVLTIRQSQKDDEGAYTCEALNSLGSLFVVPDTIVHILPPSGTCQTPYFNNKAHTKDECVKCFCFGLTTDCSSSSLYLSQISTGTSLDLVTRDERRLLGSSLVKYSPSAGQFSISDYSRKVHGSYYWSLPRQFLGNKVTSYGGKLSYVVFYTVGQSRLSTPIEVEPDVILYGSQVTLYHNRADHFLANVEQTTEIPIRESAWNLDEEGAIQARREDIMTALQNIEYILVKSNYDRSQDEVRISQIGMSTTSQRNMGLGQANLVEQCTCPEGYTGPSCEQCIPGYVRTNIGRYFGQCVKSCSCNGHSTECDAVTGRCTACQHNTEGDKCERCKPGFYGNPQGGTARDCLPCPCPLTDPSNQFASECYLDSDGEVTCRGCPPEYAGRRCEKCASGYEGNPLQRGGSCKSSVGQFCDPRGSLSIRPDPRTKQCSCKLYAEGPTCSACRGNSFYPAEINPLGCVPCFCMGVTQSCSSTSRNRAQITATFSSDAQGFAITDRAQQETHTEGILVNPRNREITFRGFHDLQGDSYYWTLPGKFLKNKVTSYGGNLRFTVLHLPGFDTTPTTYPDVEISGNDIVLEYNHNQNVPVNFATPLTVPFYENYWRRADGTSATRQHLMMALADLDFILIKAKYTQDTAESSLREVSLDVAESRNTGQERAHAVEECACPTGYRGLSCENCDVGYRRTGGGLYLGTCEPCECFGHSSDCDSNTGLCKDCQHNTEGETCDVCAEGYYGDATRGQPDDCKPCPCPLASGSNQFQSTCELDEEDGLVTCLNCPAGHTGRRCETCLPGYSGNPLRGEGCVYNNQVDNRPRISITPDSLSATTGEDVTLRCAVQGRGPFTVQWIRADGQPLSGRATIGRDHSLTIRNVQPSDSSRYICIAENAYGTSRLEAVITVSAAQLLELQVIVQEPKRQYVQEGKVVQFLCIGISPHVYVVAWTRKDEQPLDARVVDDAQGTLTINGVRPSDAGTYVCTGSDINSIATDEGYLFVESADEPPSVNVEPNYLAGYVGESVEFRCSATGLPSPHVEWTSKQLGVLPYGAIALDGVLRFESLTTQMRGTYECTASNRAGQASEVVQLDVQANEPPRVACQYYEFQCNDGSCIDDQLKCNTHFDCPDRSDEYNCESPTEPPRVACQYYEFQCNDGSCIDYRLKCDRQYDCQDGSDEDNCATPVACQYYEFQCNDGSCIDDRLKCDTHFNCPDRSDEYNCATEPSPVACQYYEFQCNDGSCIDDRLKCDSHFDCSDQSDEVDCEYEYPTVNVEPEYLDVGVGESAEFRCSASGSPFPTVTWANKQTGILPFEAIVEEGLLRFESVTKQIEGTYECTASSRAGHASRNVQLIVTGEEISDSEVLIDQPELVVRPGGEAILNCISRAREDVQDILWRKYGDDRPLSHWGAIQNQGQLVIPKCTKQQHEGRYVCTIYLVHGGERTAYSRIRVEGEEILETYPEISIEPESQTVAEGSTALIRCAVTGNPTPTIRWSKMYEGELGPNHQTYSDVLRIVNIRPEDTGSYVCEAENSMGRVQATAFIEVEAAEIRWTTRRQEEEWVVPTIVSVEPSHVLVAAGRTVEFNCSASGAHRITIEWYRVDGDSDDDDSLMPLDDSKFFVSGGLLQIRSVQVADAGQYACRIRAGSRKYKTLVQLEVQNPPVITINPSTATLRPGEHLRLECSAEGDQPITLKWEKLHGPMTSNAAIYDGILEFVAVSVADAGRYKCVATNKIGYAESQAEIIILAPPSAIVSPRSVSKIIGSTAEFHCQVTGYPPPRIQWKKEVGGLPERHTIQGGTLTIFNVQQHDKGRYYCAVTNEVGQTRDFVTLDISELKPLPPSVHEREETVMVGDRVEINCEVVGGDPAPIVKWIKVGGSLSTSIEVQDKHLVIPSVREEDQGIYRCVASNIIGTTLAQVTLNVEMAPLVPVSRQSRTVSAGSRATLTCYSRGNPPPTVKWSKRNGQLPRGHEERNGVLVIPTVRVEDFGEYVCTAENKFGSSEGIVTLELGELIPYFAQNPLSYMSFPTIREAYKEFDLELSFRPQSTDGLIFYNGQLEDGGGDFVSFGMRNRKAELRLDVGSGPVIITSNLLELDVWHTILVKRVGKDASLFVDGVEFKGQAPGSFIGLDLTENLYLGAVPEFRKISKLAAFNRGFVGCISRLVISGVTINLGGELLDINGITDCPACQYRPCQHGGTCRPAATKTGYQCHCARNYSGVHCEVIGERCTPDICGLKGKCYDAPGVSGYRCACPLGTSGRRCEFGSEIRVPSFNSTSYIAYPAIARALMEIKLNLKFKAESLDNGILLYEAFSNDGSGDFIALSLRDGYLNYQFDTGSGAANIRSLEPVEIGEWTTVNIERTKQDGSLMVNEGVAVKGFTVKSDTGVSPGNKVGLNLRTFLYLGGVDYSEVRVAPAVGVNMGFRGCVSELSVDGVRMDLIQSSMAHNHISECENGPAHLCDEYLCQNDGTCYEEGGQTSCKCPLGFNGAACEFEAPIEMSVEFYGDGFIELPSNLLPHFSPLEVEAFEMTISTTQSDAIVFWHGQTPTMQGRGKDFIAILIVGGHVVFSYELGSGPANITAVNEFVNDGLEHHIRVERTGKQGSLEFDGFALYDGESGGDMTGLNTQGNIYLGGLPDANLMTGGKFLNGFEGCIKNVSFDGDAPTDIGSDAVSGLNVQPCDS